MKKLVIFGANITAKLAHHYFKIDSDYTPIAFVVDKKYKTSDSFEGLPLIAFEEITSKYPPNEYSMFIALSYAKMNKIREQKYNEAKEKGYPIATYISSKCTYLSENKCGENCFVLEDNTIQPFAKIGNNVTLWSGNHVGHDVIIEDNCFITSHVVISGYTKVQNNCFIGVNSTLRDSITIASETLIGAGCVIMESTKPKSVHLPAKSVEISKTSDQLEL